MGTIGILVFDGLEELDAVGPWEVFARGPGQCAGRRRLVTLSPRAPGPVRGAKGLALHADHSWARRAARWTC